MTAIQMIVIQMNALAGFEPAISGLVVEWSTTVLPLLGTCCKTIRYEIYCLLTRLKDHNGKFGHFINNKWVHPEGRKSYETTSPATGQVLMPSNVSPCH
jgi:hypothetical protein